MRAITRSSTSVASEPRGQPRLLYEIAAALGFFEGAEHAAHRGVEPMTGRVNLPKGTLPIHNALRLAVAYSVQRPPDRRQESITGCRLLQDSEDAGEFR